jgi:hypothetical protein
MGYVCQYIEKNNVWKLNKFICGFFFTIWNTQNQIMITIVDGMCECNYTLKTFWLDEKNNHKFYIIYGTKWGQSSLYLKNNRNTSMNWIDVLGVIFMAFS